MEKSISLPNILPYGDYGVIVEWPGEISPEINAKVMALLACLNAYKGKGILAILPAYSSLVVQYDPLKISFNDLKEIIKKALLDKSVKTSEKGKLFLIPVCYGDEFGPDLPYVAQKNGLSEKEVVEIHSSTEYIVYMLGFLPGFAFLGGLDPKLYTPRRKEPRENVPAGSVGIANKQTGIYALSSPGGWQLIGRTPLSLFSAKRIPPSLLSPGDRVKFVPISREEFLNWQE